MLSVKNSKNREMYKIKSERKLQSTPNPSSVIRR